MDGLSISRLENRKKCHFRPIKNIENARVLNCSVIVHPPTFEPKTTSLQKDRRLEGHNPKCSVVVVVRGGDPLLTEQFSTLAFLTFFRAPK